LPRRAAEAELRLDLLLRADTLRGHMKRAFAALIVTIAATVAVHAQRIQWASFAPLPEHFTNLSVTATASGVTDGAGGSAWLVTGSSITFPPPLFFPVTITTQQLVWLNKTGHPVFNDTIAIENALVSGANIVRMSRTDVFLQIRGTENVTNNLNVLRRYVSGRTGVTFTDTALESGEVLATSVVGNNPPVPDKTGFFSYSLGIPLLTNEFVVRRYLNK
jgi:hypothetical protein